ncbi:MAG TPA: tannase/feruloyl esterase family alpha/beta hydrolase [Terriglobia bacterium]|nr:tannase/feruloyl esterase family alpha/beta hydrolase [Terriglobia bacterium]
MKSSGIEKLARQLQRFHGKSLGDLAMQMGFAGMALAALAALMLWAPAASARTCESLSTLRLPHTTVTEAEPVAGGAFPPRGRRVEVFKQLPAFCRVQATLTPTPDSDIKIEVWLPASGWNGKFLGVGNGGWAGNINYFALAQGVAKGYATVATDTGHTGTGTDARFALGHPEKLVDFSYRAVHLMTVRGKAITAAFYSRTARLSYWNGCSTGGRQGLMEAQRFPRDYNGIAEGDPASYMTHLMFAAVWPSKFILENPAAGIPREKFPMIHQAVLRACDALDGVKDGIISDPERCRFDPATIECKAGDSPSCLTAAQVELVRKVYQGPVNPHTGKQIFPGLAISSERGWRAQVGGGPREIAINYFKYVLFKNPDWNFSALNFDRDVELSDRRYSPIMDAINPNLSAFQAQGGKLIMYHGWSDPLITARESVEYYHKVVATMGGLASTRQFARLFMVPGMYHCGGGPGPTVFDKVGPLDQWVAHGAAPDKIIAAHKTAGKTDMTRPLCPYPEVAQWTGSGSTNDAANFVCVEKKSAR